MQRVFHWSSLKDAIVAVMIIALLIAGKIFLPVEEEFAPEPFHSRQVKQNRAIFHIFFSGIFFFVLLLFLLLLLLGWLFSFSFENGWKWFGDSIPQDPVQCQQLSRHFSRFFPNPWVTFISVSFSFYDVSVFVKHFLRMLFHSYRGEGGNQILRRVINDGGKNCGISH